MADIRQILANINAVLWNETWIFIIAGTGVLFTVWSGFSQYRAITHGAKVVRGSYDDPADPGAINHFQALSAALSGTVGLGNISGVALAIMLGGPGAMFWMWIVGILGMAIKLTEVTLSMLYRNTEDPDNPHGGPMWVADKAVERLRPDLAWLGKTLAVLFSICIMTSAITGGNMFQAWSVADITDEYFDVQGWISGLVLAIIVAVVLIGGIRRIGRFAGTLVPLMVAAYVIAGTWVLLDNWQAIPSMLVLMATSAFSPTEAAGAFIGGTAGSAFLFGMKRAIFSNEAGQGSSPMAHAAAKTDELFTLFLPSFPSSFSFPFFSSLLYFLRPLLFFFYFSLLSFLLNFFPSFSSLLSLLLFTSFLPFFFTSFSPSLSTGFVLHLHSSFLPSFYSSFLSPPYLVVWLLFFSSLFFSSVPRLLLFLPLPPFR